MKKGDPILRIQNVTKEYPGVLALNDVSIEITKGELHALVGENGAGKSTLVKICSGAIKPTKGSLWVNGNKVSFLTPVLSEKMGIGVIYQEFNLVNQLTVAENVFLGRAIKKGIVIDMKAMAEDAAKIFKQLHIDIDPYEIVGNLSVGYQQMVEIAKALSMKAKIIIMDEPTAPLTSAEVEDLFSTIETLKNTGVTIVYISHRLEEIFKLSDRITVMRDGEKVKTINTHESNTNELIELMVGRELKETYPSRPHLIKKDIIFEAKNLTGNGVKDISFKIQSGEILGFGGLIGAGRTELAELIFGAKPKDSGEIFMHNKEILTKTPRDSIANRIAYVPEDRKKQGILADINIRENISVSILKKLSTFSVVDIKKEHKITERYSRELTVKTPNLDVLIKKLSGGNQQKVILAKWLATEPDLIILDEPTRGIDVGAKFEIYKLINALVATGKAVMMISSEMEELIGMSDRIIVLSEGFITCELSKSEFSQNKIMEYASINAGGK